MWISPAYAQAAGGGMGGFDIVSLLPLVLIFVVFYFLLIRPQQQKMKAHRAMLSAIRRNDRVLTGGGIIGTVTKVVSDGELIVEIAEGVRVRVARGTIAEVLSRTEPVAAAGASGTGSSGGAGSGGDAKPAEQKPQGLGGLLGGLGLGGKK
jgi:preprotein translocase subunit YajC